jgi:hypothetical protein
VAAVAAGLVVGNLAIAWDFVDNGRKNGDPVGNTGRYIAAHREQPVFLVADDIGPYRYLVGGNTGWWRQWTQRFKGNSAVQNVLSSSAISTAPAQPPFSLLMSRQLLRDSEASIRDTYPGARARNITPDGKLVVLEVPRST